MKPARRAVIDVGTNSVKLLVADVSGPEVRPVLETSRQTRLGKGFYDTHKLQRGAVELTAAAVAEFAHAARDHGAVSVRVIATSAARDATNAADLVEAICATAGLGTEIISGEQEADLAFLGVTTDPSLKGKPLLLLEVGGGSSQFILGHGGHKPFRQSFPLGTLRLMDKVPHSDPPTPGELTACRDWVRGYLREKVRPGLAGAMRVELSQTPSNTLQFVGAGGSASVLGCMEAELATFDRERLERTRLSRQRLKWHVEHLWGMALEPRKQIVGLPFNRADVILAGAVIYEQVLEEFGFRELRITTRGLRFAAVM